MSTIIRKFLTAALLSFQGSISVAATPLPRYDAVAFCQQVSDGAGGSDVIKNACIQQEQGAYNALKQQWPDLPERIRNFCDQAGKSAGGSYQLLGGCVSNETAASKTTPAFRY